jgi:hypothetical protein
VYSSPDSEDWRIRGYTKCPAYQKRLSAWLSSDAFKQKEADTQALRQKVRLRAAAVNVAGGRLFTTLPDQQHAQFGQCLCWALPSVNVSTAQAAALLLA